MAVQSRSLLQRISCIKNSLENAERSFMDNKDMRGELDLMLAEAEMKNLRRRKDVPWNWNRHLLAVCAAVMLVCAGFGGWLFARDHYKSAPAPAAVKVRQQAGKSVPAAAGTLAGESRRAEGSQPEISDNDKTPSSGGTPESRVNITKADMHRLVQSARVELSNSK